MIGFTPLELTDLAEKQIKNRLQTVEGVSSITIGGEQRFAIRLWLDSEKMAAHQVTVLDVQQALLEQNVELPSGRVENWDREMTIQTRGEIKSVEAFNQLVVRQDKDRFVRLRDIGRAEQGVENERTGARNNGRPCIFLGIVKQSKANSVAVSHGIRDQLELVRPTIPDGIEMVVNYDESTFVEESISEVWLTLGFAFFLVVTVIFVFSPQLPGDTYPGYCDSCVDHCQFCGDASAGIFDQYFDDAGTGAGYWYCGR